MTDDILTPISADLDAQIKTLDDAISDAGKRLLLAAAVCLAAPAAPIVLFWNEAYWLEWLFGHHWTAGVVGLVAAFAGMGLSLLGLVRAGLEIKLRNSFRKTRADLLAFQENGAHCPITVRENEARSARS